LESRTPGKRSRTSSAGPAETNPYEDRIAVALVEAVTELGYETASVADVAARAGVGEEEFHRRYEDLEDCVLRSFDAFAAEYESRIQAAFDAFADWRTGLRSAGYEVADWAQENPRLLRFGAVDLLQARNEMIRVRREEALNFGGILIDRGRHETPEPEAIPESLSQLAVGSIVQLLTHKLQDGEQIEPVEMVPQMMYLVVRLYLGEEVAREELEEGRPLPVPSVPRRGRL
jgi:AcrR family transcriptional regulator